MLKSIDVLIGVTTVMLVLSLVVTALTQILTNVLKLRSKYLRDGILHLFERLGWQFSAQDALTLAHELVRLPLPGQKAKGVAKDAIAREDLLEKLLEMAQNEALGTAATSLRTKIAELAPGADPKDLLASLRKTSMELSVERPDLAMATVRSIAMTRTQVADLASHVFGGFDSAMDQLSARFTASSHKVVAVFGILLALAVPVDTFELAQRFARSDDARAQAMALAESLAAKDLAAQSLDQNAKDAQVNLRKLEAADVLVVPASRADWLARFGQVNWAGVIVSALLLTMGAPFWFAALKDLLKLRSAAAGQESQDRAARQSMLPAASVENTAGGEQGDLQAVGKPS